MVAPRPQFEGGGSYDFADRARDVRQSPPEAAVAEFVEVDVAVERGRLLIGRVTITARPELAVPAHTATQRNDEQVAAERPALVTPVWRPRIDSCCTRAGPVRARRWRRRGYATIAFVGIASAGRRRRPTPRVAESAREAVCGAC